MKSQWFERSLLALIAAGASLVSDRASALDPQAVWADSLVTLAAPPNSIWDTAVNQSSEMQSWGKAAITPTITANAAGNTIVYVLDMGVGRHVDLSVIEYVNPFESPVVACGVRSGAGISPCTSLNWPRVVGCNTHGTMVAGIIGAPSNSTGTLGVHPGAKVVSVSINPYDSAKGCVATSGFSDANVITALTWIKNDVISNNTTGRPAVVNLSANWFGFNSPAVRAKIEELVTPSGSYPGIFFVQSAGNYFDDACTYAYSRSTYTASASDGIMVVGAINNHGQPVVPLNGAPGFWKSRTGYYHEPGSNFGACVDVWAPGDAIFAPISSGSVSEQSPSTIYSTYAYGSGTSFAAPHVAGLAAYLLDTDSSLTTPALVEAKVRSKFVALGSKAPSSNLPANYHTADGLAINIATLSPPSGAKNTPYAEYLLHGLNCIQPPYFSTVPCVAGHSAQFMLGYRYSSTWSVAQEPFSSGTVPEYWAPNMYTLKWRFSDGFLSVSFDSYGPPSGYSCSVEYYMMSWSGPITLGAAVQRSVYASTAYGTNPLFTSSCTSAHVAAY